MNVYFVTTGLWEETQVIKRVRPRRLLCSYWYFKNKPLSKFCADLGYQPEILLDSGGYTAYTKGKRVNVLDYIDYIRANRAHISEYITLDVIGDPRTSRHLWDLLRALGLRPTPVVHYGADLEIVGQYLANGAHRIALGNTVPIRDKALVARWCAGVKERYPAAGLHLLGSSSQAISQSQALESCDASTWYLQAVMGSPSTIPGRDRDAKMRRAEANMRRIMEVFNETGISSDDHGVEPADSEV